MRDLLGDVFDTLLTGEPPLALSPTEVEPRTAGGGSTAAARLHRRRIGGGGRPDGRHGRAVRVGPGPHPAARPDGDLDRAATQRRPATAAVEPATLVVERPHCNGEPIGTMKLDWTDRSVMPDTDAAVAAVLRTAARPRPAARSPSYPRPPADDSASSTGCRC